MKFIISQIIFALILICVSECQRYTINKVYNDIFKVKGKFNYAEKQSKIIKEINKDCIKSFLKLPQNGKLAVNEIEQIVLGKTAVAKCLKDEDEYFRFLISTELEEREFQIQECFKIHLQNLEPTSILVQNFTSNLNDTQTEKCLSVIPDYTAAGEVFEKKFGAIENFTCGVVTRVKELMIISFKIFILEGKDLDKNIKEVETNRITGIIKSLFYRVADCILERIENNRGAYSQNITLQNSFDLEYAEDSAEDSTNQTIPEDQRAFYEACEKYGKAINEDCVKERLNLEKYGDKELVKVEDRIIYASTEIKCMKPDLYEFANLFLDLAKESSFLSRDFLKESAKKLETFEPGYMLLKYNNTVNISKYFFYRKPYLDFDDLAGTLDEVTCGVLSGNDLEKYQLKIDLIVFEEDKVLKTAAFKEFVDEVVPKVHKISDCFIERLK